MGRRIRLPHRGELRSAHSSRVVVDNRGPKALVLPLHLGFVVELLSTCPRRGSLTGLCLFRRRELLDRPMHDDLKRNYEKGRDG
jgi:hypothetical protein